MATRRYGLKVGEGFTAVTEAAGAAVSSDTVELTVELATTAVADKGTTRTIAREEVLEIIEKLKAHILKGIWPPA